MALKDSVLNVVIRAKDATGDGFRRLRGSIGGAESSTNKLGDSIKRAVVAIGALAATYLSLRAITGFFTAAVKESADFEEQLAKVEAVSGATADEMGRLKEAATEMGATTTFNASQAANAMETLSRAGLNTEETLQALPEVLALARGNSIELAEAASLVTQSIQGMGGTFAESGRYADVLTRAAQRANTNVTGLGQALSYAAPTARALGLDVEQTAALVGKLADAGIDASRAGTALNSIFSQFQNPASKFRGELDALGISTNDFSDALEQLEGAGANGQAAINAVGQEAGPALRALLAQGTGSLRELEAELRKAGGAAQEAADTMDDTLPGALERLGSAWRTLKRAIGDNVLGPAKDAVDELAAGIADFVSSGGVEKLGQDFRAMFIDITDRAREFIKAFDFKSATEKAGTALREFGDSLASIKTGLQVTGNVISTVFNGIGFVVGGAMATIAKGLALVGFAASGAVQLLNKVGITSDQFAQKTSDHVNALNASADAMMNYSVGALTQVGKNLGVVAEETKKATKETKAQKDAAADAAVANNFWAFAAKGAGGALDEVSAAADKGAVAAEEQAQKVSDLQANYDALKASGTASVQELGEALVALNREQEKAVQSSAALEAAYRTLGTTSQAELIKAAETAKTAFETIQASGTASAEDVQRAYAAYAKTVKETGDQTLISAVEAKGAALGLTEQLEATGKAGETAGTQIKAGLDKAAVASAELKVQEDAAAAAAEARTSKLAAWGNAFGKALTNARESVTALSSAARNLFEAKIGGNAFVSESESASESLEKTRRRVDELESSRRRLMSNSFAAWFTDTALAAQVVKKEFLKQKVAADALLESIQAGNVSLNQMSAASLKASGQFDLLDDQTLSGLQSAINSARSKLESLNSSAESTLNGLRQRLADIQGDTEEAQRLQYEAERKRLQVELESAQQAGANNAAADYQRALDQLSKINTIEQKNRREAENQREREAADRQARQEQAERERQAAEATQRRDASTTTNRQDSQGSRQTIVLQTPQGGTTEVQTNDPDGFLSALEQAGLRSAN
jgi:TP901 family phage tail tape measure protein